MELAKNISQIKIVKSLFAIVLGSIALTISAKIKIPFYPVPMTMQTLVVLLIGIGFGWKLGVATVFLYLFEGAIGLPVFSGTPEKGVGLIYLTGPTMGYLLGFLVAVFFAGKFNYNKNFILNFTKLTVSTSFIYIFGIIWLGGLIGWDKPVFELGVKPFLLAELLKILIASVIVNKFKKLRKII